MRRAIVGAAAALLLILGTGTGRLVPGFGAAPALADDPLANPCAPPSQISPTIEETAWQLWVAATCPVNNAKYPFVVWENWIEQAQMYPANPAKGLVVPNAAAASGSAVHLVHASPLAIVKNPKL